MDEDLQEQMRKEIQVLEDIANDNNVWPAHYDDLVREIKNRYQKIQDDKIEEIVWND